MLPHPATSSQVAPALLAALQQPEQLRSPGFSELLDECAEKAGLGTVGGACALCVFLMMPLMCREDRSFGLPRGFPVAVHSGRGD